MHAPEEIRLAEGTNILAIRWDDGHESPYPFSYLRGACPCAGCKGHHRKVDIASIQPKEGVFLVDYETQGRYALRLLWSDAHQTGIYTYDYLRAICRCGECRARGGA